jgi:hypothetical protein
MIVFLIKIYQYIISPMNNQCCRFYPTCSAYSIEAIQIHGMRKGVFYSLCRIMRCNRLFPAGLDFVPEPKKITKDYI